MNASVQEFVKNCLADADTFSTDFKAQAIKEQTDFLEKIDKMDQDGEIENEDENFDALVVLFEEK
jgi:hypothetical protein